jgi:repressor LexA
MVANGAPPTRVEIADNFGFRSPNAAEDHLKALDRKGHIELRSGTSRGIMISESARLNSMLENDMPELGNSNGMAVIGDVAAGAPIFASQHIQKMVSVDQSLFSEKADFLLKVRGDSMINIGIFEHDLLAIRKANTARNNQIVVARIDDEVTVKRYQRHAASVSLIAENDNYPPIEVDLQTQSFAIEGVVVGLIRQGL